MNSTGDLTVISLNYCVFGEWAVAVDWCVCLACASRARAHASMWWAGVKLSGIRFSVDGKDGFHVAALNCCQSIHETGSKQKTWCDDKHE